ncbi:unnamed protein product [Cochlearia groenlandica]
MTNHKFDDESTTNRSFIPFPPSPWGDHFLHVSVNHTEMDGLWREIEELKPKVNAMLLPSHGYDSKHIICLIHTLINLGISYLFENEIIVFLKDSFKNIKDIIMGCNEDDLYTVSVVFRVFRLYGHDMSPDIFNIFKGGDGKFKKCLIDDVRGMLSLYEASQFATTKEDILDEAMSFTKTHLELFVVGAKATHHPHLTKLIKSALYIPQNYNLEILVARQYIGFYEKETDHDEMLLKLAKLSFKFLQLQYIRDLKTLTKWWAELDLASKIPNYFRERVVVSYYWAAGIYYEPQYSDARITLAKGIMITEIVDSTFDAYGTLAELKSLVRAVERWKCDPVDVLPDYLKIVYRTILDWYKDPQGKLKISMKAYLQEAEWASEGEVPSYEEYIEVGASTTSGEVLLATTFIGMGETVGDEIYAWLLTRPKLTQALFLKSRLRDDIPTFKEEMSRGDIANGINCYIKQYGVTEEEAALEFEKMIDHKSKVMNEEFLKCAKFIPIHILRPVLNYGRLADVSYKYGDEFTFAKDKIKDYITCLFFDIITL